MHFTETLLSKSDYSDPLERAQILIKASRDISSAAALLTTAISNLNMVAHEDLLRVTDE